MPRLTGSLVSLIWPTNKVLNLLWSMSFVLVRPVGKSKNTSRMHMS
uniref:Uncharacterized protein n=1 Tax=Anguilla anguilla TaxID=7936 RepID=A0A0E9QF82_ANGAN